eukprot:TRINITY_DN2690_c0_g2_i2.p1 TRINITY_DN2690_c0_g2~~TRINITY_DN2690_c0_g2_i2.p1  ORF type:complete len:641 (-),score=126.02 TRINITY_DN2690_c0_g2_i2:83-2005(-)
MSSFTIRTVIVHLHNDTNEDLYLAGFYTDFHTFFRIPPPELLQAKSSFIFGTDCIHAQAEGIARTTYRGAAADCQLQIDWRFGSEGFDIAGSSSVWRVDKSAAVEQSSVRAHVYYVIKDQGSTDTRPVTIRELGAVVQANDITIAELLDLKMMHADKRSTADSLTPDEINEQLVTLFEDKVVYLALLDKLQDYLAQFFRVPATKAFRVVVTAPWNVEKEPNKTEDSEFLQLEKGGIIIVLDSTHPCWWYGELQKENVRGFFPSNHVCSDFMKLRPKVPPKIANLTQGRLQDRSRSEPPMVRSDHSRDGGHIIGSGGEEPLIIEHRNVSPSSTPRSPIRPEEAHSPECRRTPRSPTRQEEVRSDYTSASLTASPRSPAKQEEAHSEPPSASPFGTPRPRIVPIPHPKPPGINRIARGASSPNLLQGTEENDEVHGFVSPRRRRKQAQGGETRIFPGFIHGRLDSIDCYDNEELSYKYEERSQREEQKKREEAEELARRERAQQEDKESLAMLEMLREQEWKLRQALPLTPREGEKGGLEGEEGGKKEVRMSGILAWHERTNEDLDQILSWDPLEEERRERAALEQREKEREERARERESRESEKEERVKGDADMDFEMMLSSLSDLIKDTKIGTTDATTNF